jgi:hypothetical protein
MAPAPETANEFLSSDEVIDVLQRDPLLRLMALTCVLPAVRIDDEWRFRRADLNDWIARQKAAGGS